MIKTDLPVLILRQIILLPNNELRIEFDNTSKSIIDISSLFHDDYIFVVSINTLEEKINTNELPKVGVIAHLENKTILPSGNVRVVLRSISRAHVHEYLNHSIESLEAIVSASSEKNIEDDLLVDKIKKEVVKFVNDNPYIGNELLKVKDITSISTITDIVSACLNLTYGRKNEYLTTLDVKKRSEMLLSDIYKESQIINIEKEIDEKTKKEIDKSQKEFILKERIKTIQKELGSDSNDEINELKEKIDNLKCNENVREKLLKELKSYSNLPLLSPESSVLKQHIEYLLELPWLNKTKENTNLRRAQEILDKSHYGMNKVKDRIIEYLAILKNTKKISNNILCLVGPPGVGKTSLVSSVARAMNRKFVKISLGGVDDVSEIIGHRKTYVAATSGRIISSLKKIKVNNPVFLIDEIDKLTKSINGDPASALLEVLDVNQNKSFIDNYVEEEFDLSNVLFVLTANSIENIPYPLRDRLEIIELQGYTEKEKLEIVKNYMLPKICKNNGLNGINISDNDILYIIKNYTRESGVRDLERKIDTIIRKIVTKKQLENKMIKSINKKKINDFLGSSIKDVKINSDIGIVNGLAYTSCGGELLPIEVVSYKGNGELILTGSLGDIMKESAIIALSYIKANANYFKIDTKKLKDLDIHIHVPEGAIPKDGPSAGIALTTSLISMFKGIRASNDIAMTGEITLHGNILPIGGLREKSMGALKNGIKKIIIPYDNYSDVEELPKEIKDNIKYIGVKNYKEAFKYIFSGGNDEK